MRLSAGVFLASFGCAPGDAPAPPCEQAGQLCTVAGTGQAGFNGDGLAGTESWLYWPSAVTFDPNGVLTLVDFNNVRVRQLMDGGLRTVAGNGVHGWSVPGTPVLESPLENPIDVAFGADGRWYIAALHEARVLQVEDGIILPFAGSGELGFAGDEGPAVDASLSEVAGIETGPDGSLYIADTGNHCLRWVDGDGVIHTLGGQGIPGWDGDGGPVTSARFNSPGRLHLHERDLYVADTGNHTIRKINLDSGLIQSIAGTGSPGYAGDGGPAYLATLYAPAGASVGPDNTVYIADSGNHVVRAVGADGTITTLAGTGATATAGAKVQDGDALTVDLGAPVDVTADERHLWFADQQLSVVRRVTLR